MTLALILLAVACLAYANGANDNFKGVATLFGSGTTNYRRALAWATLTTLLGSLTAVLLAGRLLKAFTGSGLVDGGLAAAPGYAAAVALGAGLTVLLATRLGMPVSTTHALVGALFGAGWMAGSSVDMARLAQGFFTPLLLSPLLAVVAVALCHPLLRGVRQRWGITEETCFCIGTEAVEVVPVLDHTAALARVEQLTATLDSPVVCRRRYSGRLLGVQVGAVVDQLHYLSAGVVSFARGLNDTPKIAALLLVVPTLETFGSAAAVGVAIAVGGLLAARRVAETMSSRITPMTHGQGLTANLITGAIVIGASRLGLPVSTTHVSCGALFGIGTATRQGNAAMIGKILGAWLLTLPLGATLGAACYRAVQLF